MSNEPWKDGASGDEDDVPPDLRWLYRRMMKAESPEEQAKQRKQYEEMLRQGDMRFEVMPRFHLERSCMKCGYSGSDPGFKNPGCMYVPEGMLPGLTGHHDVVARRCRRCAYVWMERSLEDDDGGRDFLVPVYDLAGVISDVYLAVYKTLVTDEFAPMAPSELADAIRKRLAERGHLAPKDGAP